MYLCIAYSGGLMTATEVNTVAECSASNYIAAPQTQFSDLPTLTDIFSVPVVADLQDMWMLGFATPIICYLTAWAFQSVISWFSHRGYY